MGNKEGSVPGRLLANPKCRRGNGCQPGAVDFTDGLLSRRPQPGLGADQLGNVSAAAWERAGNADVLPGRRKVCECVSHAVGRSGSALWHPACEAGRLLPGVPGDKPRSCGRRAVGGGDGGRGHRRLQRRAPGAAGGLAGINLFRLEPESVVAVPCEFGHRDFWRRCPARTRSGTSLSRELHDWPGLL